MKYLLLAIFLVGCTSTAVEYARARNPDCKIKVLEENRDGAKVLVTCPDVEPFEQTFRKR